MIPQIYEKQEPTKDLCTRCQKRVEEGELFILYMDEDEDSPYIGGTLPMQVHLNCVLQHTNERIVKQVIDKQYIRDMVVDNL